MAIWAFFVFAMVLLVVPLGMGLALTGGKDLRLSVMSGLFASFLVFEVLAMFFHAVMGSLRLMTVLWSAACGALAVWGYWKACHARRAPRLPALPWNRAQAALLAVAVAMVALQTLNTVLNTFHGNFDDGTYCANATTSWYTDTVARYTPSTGELRPPFYNIDYVVASWPVYSAMLAVLTGVHPAILFRTILPLFEIPLAYLIAYWLLERFFANSRTKALLGLIYYVCFVVAAAEHMGQNSNEWWLVVDVWTGKALSFAIVTPLILWLLIRIEEDPPGERPRLWRVLLLVCWGGFFISATLFYVIPMELLIWGGGRLLRVRQGEDIPRYLLCVAPAAACALLSFLL